MHVSFAVRPVHLAWTVVARFRSTAVLSTMRLRRCCCGEEMSIVCWSWTWTFIRRAEAVNLCRAAVGVLGVEGVSPTLLLLLLDRLPPPSLFEPWH